MENQYQQMAVMTVFYLIIVLYIIFVTITKKVSYYLNIAYLLILTVPFIYLYKTNYFSNLELLRQSNPEKFYTILFIFSVGLFATFYGIMNARIYPSSYFLIVLSMTIVFLAIIYKITYRSTREVTKTKISKIQAWASFIFKFIFYIPCLLIEVIEYINKDFKNVNSTIYNLLAILIILIFLYFQNEKILSYLSKNDDGVQIVNEPLYLNRHQNMGSVASYKIKPIIDNNNQNIQIPNSLSQNNTEITNYTLSMWVFINPVPSNYKGYSSYTNKENKYHIGSNIFRIGSEYIENENIYTTSKPALVYVNNIDEKTKEHYGVYRLFNIGGETDDIIEFRAVEQKWNLITITMSNTIDVFVNGELIVSKNRTFKGFVIQNGDSEKEYKTPVLGTDSFIVGNRNGLDGAICNTLFYPRVLTQQEILSHHLMLFQLNPPIFFIKK